MTTLDTTRSAVPPPSDASPEGHRQRWAILAVVCMAVFVTVLDGTIVNVALPSLSVELGASTRQLQWIVDSYLLVFTGLLLAAGGLGDKYGRKRTLIAGLVAFGATSAYAGSADSAEALIAGRALMGIGAALIFPATLAIITNVFRDPTERAKAIGVWSAVSGVAVAAGPITGGWLLENFWWGSVFFINVPITIVVALLTWRLIPESKEQDAPGLDRTGLLLSIAAITALVLTIIEAPEWGWLSATTFAGFGVAAVLLVAFVRWELRVASPMLPVTIFRNLRFSAASVAITSAFFALFGFIFLITQYFQLVRGYGPLEAGLRTLPVAFSIAIASVAAPRIVERLGTTSVVRAGLALLAAAFVWISFRVEVDTAYLEIVGQMIFLGVGLGLTTAPATESIMGSLSADKAGVGSAVNDTTRELGGTLGVAIIGSVFSSVYIGALGDSDRGVFAQLPPETQELTQESVGAARFIAAELGPNAPAYLAEVNDAFLSGLAVGCLVAAGVAAGGAVFASRFLPARAT
ncbi:MAG: DHA2 family efflux MFS transporter permease subunit [Ilumatobacter sp.]|uniref:DHA2 family efflux MFS transporter permease subunit n=1 Tax=Ilumatobacter sp. TaxID=1967498 RepID=UPI002632734D|nr:DHA2 family efflux MFS transporter permease subunit [Ilumatobacter sp.]MDJ0771075.1 DHA2 family efflux MFS transporter permease subunit [Ilumatobacter sp.]